MSGDVGAVSETVSSSEATCAPRAVCALLLDARSTATTEK